jgi:signal transduction histidine kinase
MKAASKSSLSVGLILQSSLLALALSSAIAFGIVLISAWDEFSWARHVQAVADFDRVTYETTTISRLVRGKVRGAYFGEDDPRDNVKKFHQEYDLMLDQALAHMDPAVIPGTAEHIAAIRAAWINLEGLWHELETLDPSLPKDVRYKALSKWFQATDAIVNPLVALVLMETGEIRLTDPAIAELVMARQLSWALWDTAGQECRIMRSYVSGAERTPPELAAKIGALREDGTATWRVMDDLLARPGAPAELLRAVATAKTVIASTAPQLDAIYQPIFAGNRQKQSGAAESSHRWNNLCVGEQLRSLLNVGATADDLIERRAEAVERTAAQRLAFAVVGLAGAIAVSLLALWLVRRRVMYPIVLLRDAIQHLTQRDYSVPVPQLRHRDEFGGMAMTLEALRIGALEAERAAAERQHSQKLEALGTLAGGIAHDLNNTLVPVLSLAKLTGRRLPEGSRERANLDTILNAGSRASDLVKQILAFARKEQVEKQPVDLTALTRETLKLLRASIPATIRLTEDIDEVAPIVGNPGQLHQVIINVVTNGAQAIDGKIGQITVSLKEHQERDAATGNKLVRLTVLDTGIGMDEKMLSRIFDPFFTTKPVGEGTGLGLSVVHGIITDHGGRIEVTSRSGKGTQFHIYLPALNANLRMHPAEGRALKSRPTLCRSDEVRGRSPANW